MENQGFYVSCDFGIVQFNLQTLLLVILTSLVIMELRSVNQTALFNGFIYAATNAGIRRASISNNNLNDFKQWEIVATGNWFSVAALNRS
jgi:hypothetical protein